jgi:hypothetical protein
MNERPKERALNSLCCATPATSPRERSHKGAGDVASRQQPENQYRPNTTIVNGFVV